MFLALGGNLPQPLSIPHFCSHLPPQVFPVKGAGPKALFIALGGNLPQPIPKSLLPSLVDERPIQLPCTSAADLDHLIL